ncbi:hypothetical protein Rhal01_00627 [Rubritalea halochordaticola]|uniref:Ice-binding protein C-terminal domain-containing protein n=2 Tax=Rubritalea halochordaticola TaxID=714537 RepID=A0ABP9V051_9BACT
MTQTAGSYTNNTMNPMTKTILLSSTLLLGGMVHGATLFTSNFDGNDSATTGYLKNSSGSSSVTVSWTNVNTAVSNISNISVVSPAGGFINQGSAYSDGNNLYVNHNLNIDDRADARGYSFTFTLDSAFSLTNLQVISGHTNDTGSQNQAFASDLTFTLSGGSLGSDLTETKLQLDYTGIDYITSDFDLGNTVIDAGTYTITVFENNMGGGGAYAIYDGITLEGTAAIPEPSSTALVGLAGLGFILRRRR